MSAVRVQDYPDLRKDGPGIVNVNERECLRAIARKKSESENKRLRSRVDALEFQLTEILAALRGT